MVNRLGLGKLIGLCEFLFLFRVFLQLPQRFSSIFHFLRVGVELLDGVLDEIVSFVVLPASFIGTLLGEHRFLRLGRVVSNLEQFFLNVVGWALFVEGEGVRVVNWSTVAQSRIFDLWNCLFIGFKCSQTTQFRVKVDICLSVAQPHHNLVYGSTPSTPTYRTLPNS